MTGVGHSIRQNSGLDGSVARDLPALSKKTVVDRIPTLIDTSAPVGVNTHGLTHVKTKLSVRQVLQLEANKHAFI